MSKIDETKPNWDGLICPVCRFVFRIPINHSGAGVVCPACAHLLQIPTVEQRQMCANVSLAKARKALAQRDELEKVVDRAVVDSLPQNRAVRDHGHEAAVDDLPCSNESSQVIDQTSQNHCELGGYRREPSWEQESSTVEPISPMTWILSGSLLGVSIILMGIWLMMQSADDQTMTVLIDDKQTEFSAATDKADIVEDDQGRMVQESKKIIERFLTTESVSELEKLVRTPDVTMPRIRAWYEDDAWEAQGFRVLGYKKSIAIDDEIVSMDVQLKDFTVRSISVVKTDNGYKIDWESWVAWSPIKWEDLFLLRPNRPVEVRVLCKRVNYYNRLFQDSNKWFAVRMSHPDFDRSIYGYIDSGMPQFYGFIAELLRGEEVPATLKISYPSNTSVGNQVTINEYLKSGWTRDLPAESQAQQPASQ
ncbi:MAG: hypothetical protein ACPIA7_02245 [Akkermansiaceae bacterium]